MEARPLSGWSPTRTRNDRYLRHAPFAAIVGERNTISSPTGLRTYECDGLLGYRIRPRLVVLPASTEEVAACVRLARTHELPIVPRGAGTGLSGGSLPRLDGAVVIGLAADDEDLVRTERPEPGGCACSRA